MRRLLLLLVLCAVTLPAAAQKNDWQYWETPMQFTPIIFDLGAEYLGIQPKHNVWERTVAVAAGYGSMFLITQGLKYTVKELRPDGTNYHSFPSGHTAAAITGAELIRLDYGWGWGAVFYACGGAVAYGRVIHNRHWWWDTVAGAVVGVFSAGIGHWVAESLDLGDKEEGKLSLAPSYDPFSGAYCANFVLRF
ncbi:MAG: phosphatase PAP2 family protein [Bacteroidales bacterium]|nr:phosphatase PAP2 family protein [Bacteroidales bacterium]